MTREGGLAERRSPPPPGRCRALPGDRYDRRRGRVSRSADDPPVDGPVPPAEVILVPFPPAEEIVFPESVPDPVLDAARQEHHPGTCLPVIRVVPGIVEEEGPVPPDLERGRQISAIPGEERETQTIGGQEPFGHLAKKSFH